MAYGSVRVIKSQDSRRKEWSEHRTERCSKREWDSHIWNKTLWHVRSQPTNRNGKKRSQKKRDSKYIDISMWNKGALPEQTGNVDVYFRGLFSFSFSPWIFLYFDVHGEEALSNWILVYDFSSLFPFQYLSNKKWNVGLRLSKCLDQNDMPMKNNIPDKMQFVRTKCWAQHNIFWFCVRFLYFFRNHDLNFV